jgi:hypothetical protein
VFILIGRSLTGSGPLVDHFGGPAAVADPVAFMKGLGWGYRSSYGPRATDPVEVAEEG